MIEGTDKLGGEPKTQYTPKSSTPGERCSNCEHFVSPNELTLFEVNQMKSDLPLDRFIELCVRIAVRNDRG